MDKWLKNKPPEKQMTDAFFKNIILHKEAENIFLHGRALKLPLSFLPDNLWDVLAVLVHNDYT